jgi:hypothetical protein
MLIHGLIRQTNSDTYKLINGKVHQHVRLLLNIVVIDFQNFPSNKLQQSRLC